MRAVAEEAFHGDAWPGGPCGEGRCGPNLLSEHRRSAGRFTVVTVVSPRGSFSSVWRLPYLNNERLPANRGSPRPRGCSLATGSWARTGRRTPPATDRHAPLCNRVRLRVSQARRPAAARGHEGVPDSLASSRGVSFQSSGNRIAAGGRVGDATAPLPLRRYQPTVTHRQRCSHS